MGGGLLHHQFQSYQLPAEVGFKPGRPLGLHQTLDLQIAVCWIRSNRHKQLPWEGTRLAG